MIFFFFDKTTLRSSYFIGTKNTSNFYKIKILERKKNLFVLKMKPAGLNQLPCNENTKLRKQNFPLFMVDKKGKFKNDNDIINLFIGIVSLEYKLPVSINLISKIIFKLFRISHPTDTEIISVYCPIA